MAIDKLYDEKEAAAMLGVKPCTLRTWRSRPPESAPKFTKVGRLVRYSERELQRWLQSRTLK